VTIVAEIKTVRARYWPRDISTLFIGESAPSSGDFFYYGGNQLWREMKRAVEAAFRPGDDFLERFKAYGWYLDDLVLRPINDLPRVDRKKACLEAQDSLVSRIKEYRPRAIVCLLLGIKPFVKAAAKAAGCNAPFYAVAFPVRHGRRFGKEIKPIFPLLPKTDAI
jgi:hypothetical protein